jgi:hypothetical protein
MRPDLFWIPTPWLGRLAIAARPRGGEWLYDELSSLHAAGVDVIVSLLTEEETIELGLGRRGRGGQGCPSRVHLLSHPGPRSSVLRFRARVSDRDNLEGPDGGEKRRFSLPSGTWPLGFDRGRGPRGVGSRSGAGNRNHKSRSRSSHPGNPGAARLDSGASISTPSSRPLNLSQLLQKLSADR